MTYATAVGTTREQFGVDVRVNSGVKVDRINGGEVDTLYVAG